MTKAEILDSIRLDEGYDIVEYVETENIFFIIVDKGKSKDFCNFTTGVFAKWKSNGDWFTPNYSKNEDVYREIEGKKNMAASLK